VLPVVIAETVVPLADATYEALGIGFSLIVVVGFGADAGVDTGATLLETEVALAEVEELELAPGQVKLNRGVSLRVEPTIPKLGLGVPS
jgi:hypothetical protein